MFVCFQFIIFFIKLDLSKCRQNYFKIIIIQLVLAQWNSTFLHFQLLQRAPQKRCCNLQCHLSPYKTKPSVSLNKKRIFKHYNSYKKTSINKHYFCHKKNSDDLFRATLYRLMLVLHKDVLFHNSNHTLILKMPKLNVVNVNRHHLFINKAPIIEIGLEQALLVFILFYFFQHLNM